MRAFISKAKEIDQSEENMGCGSCSTGGCSTGGCGQSGGCATGGCNKLNTYDWFDGMQQPNQSEHNNVYEIRFKNTRKEFFRNVNGLSLITGDFVAVESDRGFDVGQISLGGILAQLQMKKKKIRGGPAKNRKILRRATNDDLDKLRLARSREQETLVRSREIVRMLNIDMKMSEVEYQGDNTKAIFYYIADQRVDFRELIKLLANDFKIRVEMKQIGLRFESALVGGIGSCGRELCCSTWLTDFKTVSTAAARYQNLSLNPMKISGQCGRLKCCLNFELDSYLDAIKGIPKVDRIETNMGMAFLQKTDIFKRTMWFSYANESAWIAMDVEKVQEMAEMNANGVKPASLHILDKIIHEDDKEMDFVDVVGQSVYREEPKRKKKKKKPTNRNSDRRSGGAPQARNKPAKGDGPGNEADPNAKPPRTGENKRRSNSRKNTGNPRGERKPRTDQPQNDGQQQNQNPDAGAPREKGDFRKVNKKPQSDRPKRNLDIKKDNPKSPSADGEGNKRQNTRGGRGGKKRNQNGGDGNADNKPTPPSE